MSAISWNGGHGSPKASLSRGVAGNPRGSPEYINGLHVSQAKRTTRRIEGGSNASDTPIGHGARLWVGSELERCADDGKPSPSEQQRHRHNQQRRPECRLLIEEVAGALPVGRNGVEPAQDGGMRDQVRPYKAPGDGRQQRPAQRQWRSDQERDSDELSRLHQRAA